MVSLTFFRARSHRLPGVTKRVNMCVTVLLREFCTICKSCYFSALPGVLLNVPYSVRETKHSCNFCNMVSRVIIISLKKLKFHFKRFDGIALKMIQICTYFTENVCFLYSNATGNKLKMAAP